MGCDMTRITSAQNPLIRRLKALGDKKTREAEGLMLVEGDVMLREALAAGLRPDCALAEEGGRFDQLLNMLASAGARLYEVPRALIEAVCGTRTPQGVCAAVTLPPEPAEDDFPGLIVALDGVQDPGNVGTIWRTADAAGFGGLIMTRACADPFSPKVQRAAMGSGFRLPVWQRDALTDTLASLKGSGYTVISSALDGEPFYGAALPDDKIVLVIGSEAHGVSAPVQAMSDRRLKLPMRGKAESLNAAVAAGIMMYELTRPR